MTALDGIEAEWRAQQEQNPGAAGGMSAGYSNSYSSWMSFGTSVIGTIVENLQVQISKVHLRFECQSFALGFFVESLAAETCDSDWVPTFVHRTSSDDVAFKLVRLQNTIIYLNTKAEPYGDMEMSDFMVSRTCRRDRSFDGHADEALLTFCRQRCHPLLIPPRASAF